MMRWTQKERINRRETGTSQKPSRFIHRLHENTNETSGDRTKLARQLNWGN